jgi:hypothetical protein
LPLESLTILDFSDREFLLVLVDVADADGWADSLQVANQLDLKSRKLASSRLSWLRRYGAVEREHVRDEHGAIRYHRNGKAMTTQRWRLTELGEQLAYGKLRKGDARALEGMNAGQMLLAARVISERTNDDSGMSKLVQREWRYGHGGYR